jgi:luciferase family oxidoreductase group 1
MLPNHAPLIIAEQFGTLETLFPGRIDLGLGRAPGADPAAAQALRRTLAGGADRFPDDVVELLGYLAPAVPGQRVMAVPGAGTEVPVWILGSSLYGASLAAALGLPFAFASHFMPAQLMEALALYRSRFEPSERLQAPYVMLGVSAVVADSDAEAQVLASSLEQAFVNLRRGRPGRLPPPRAGYRQQLSAVEQALLDEALECGLIGSPETVSRAMQAFVERTGADEPMVTAQIFDHSRACGPTAPRRRARSLGGAPISAPPDPGYQTSFLGSAPLAPAAGAGSVRATYPRATYQTSRVPHLEVGPSGHPTEFPSKGARTCGSAVVRILLVCSPQRGGFHVVAASHV